MAFRKIEAGLVHADVDQFIGKTGTIFYDNSLGDFRISDGTTPGGIALSFGGGEGGTYTLPTATTTVKGGVKIDGSTIVIANQVISVGTVPYSKLTDTPTIPTNTNQLTNGAGFITSSALSTYALSSSVSTNNNQLSNGAGYITSAALSGYATETYVTTRGYLTAVSWNDISSKPTFATVATSGSYADLTDKPTLVTSYTQLTDRPTLFSGSYTDLTNKPTIPTDINQLTDVSGLLEGGGGGGGTTYITNTVENPYSWSIAGDDSTLREIANGESIKISGSNGVTVTTDAEGNVIITGPSLAGLATESYVTSQGYITSNALTDLATEINKKANIADLVLTIAGDDSTEKTISLGEGIRLQGTGSITITTDLEGKITINGAAPDLSAYALTSAIPTDNNQLSNSAGYITTAVNANGTFSLPILSAAPNNLQAGQIALTNGTSWDPLGKNDGTPYMAIYTGSTWVDIGGLSRTEVYTQILELG